MADLEKTPVITFKTDDSGMLKGVTSVKELKTAIAQLKDEIVRMRQAGEDTTKATTNLQAAQRELNTVMGLAKKGADGVEGSYDSLVAKLREAKTEWRALPQFINGELNPAWEKARQDVENYTSELKNMDASVGTYTRNVGNYKSALDGWNGTLGQAAQVGGQFNNGLAAMANMLSLVGVDTDGMNDTMKALAITIGLLNGARGLTGFIKNLGLSATAEKAETAATKANTVSHTTNTAAKGAETVATWSLKTAVDALKATLSGGVSLIIGAVIAGLSALITWLIGAKDASDDLGDSLKNTTDYLDSFKESMDELNAEDNHQLALMRARGASEEEIHKKKIENLEKEREREKQIADMAERRLTTNKNIVAEVKKGSDAYKAATAEIEKDTKARDDALKKQKEITTEIRRQNELYEAQKEGDKNKNKGGKGKTPEQLAEEQQQKELEEALKKSLETIKEGEKEATKVIQEHETELETINREYEERVALIKRAIAETRKLSGETADVSYYERALILAKTDYYRKRYEAQTAEKEKEISKEIEKQYSFRKENEETNQKLLGSTNTYYKYSISISAKDKERVALLKAQVASIKEYLTTVEKINADIYNERLTREDYEKEFGLEEPAITALLQYFSKSAELKSAEQDALASLLASFEDAFNKAIEDGNFKVAEHLMSHFFFGGGDDSVMRKLFEEAGVLNAHAYQKGFEKQLLDAELADPAAKLGSSFSNYFQGDVKTGFLVIDRLKAEIEELKKSSEDWAYAELLEKEEELYKKRLEIFTAIFRQQQKVIENYGVSTGKVLGAVGDFWNEVLQAQVKSGKKSEEQAKKSFKAVKALQISTAVINTAAAIVQALADTTVPSFYVKAANAAAAGIAGAAEVVKIMNTDFGGTGSGNVGNTTAPTLTQSAPMVNTYGINPADYAEANAQNPVRVFVLEEDITNAQNAAKVRVSESTF